MTLPLKQEACSLCDELGEDAARTCSVNTLCFNAPDHCRGETTDGIGLIRDLRDNRGISLADRKVLVLGAGGAARAILPVLADCAPASLRLANRTLARAETLLRELSLSCSALAWEDLADAGAHDVIIHATSAGLTGDLPSLPDGLLAAGGCCYDLMYADEPTAFVLWGQGQGAAVSCDGWGMLVEQAAEAFFPLARGSSVYGAAAARQGSDGVRHVVRKFRPVTRCVNALTEGLGKAVACLVLLLVCLVAYDVTMRYVFNAGSVALQEMEWHLFSLLILLSSGYAFKHDAHVRLDILYQSRWLNERHRAWVDFLGTILFLMPFCLWVAHSSWSFVEQSFVHAETSPDPGGLAYRWLIKACIPVGFLLLALQGLAYALEKLDFLYGKPRA